MSHQIDARTLKQLREARNLTQKQLAERCNCTKDTVSRWERGETSRVRSHLRKPLCKALGIEWDTLTQPPTNDAVQRDDLVQVGARVRPEVRNALQTVCARYKVDQRIVFEYAPLLFLIIAEKSLKVRREKLDQIESEIWASYDAMHSRAPYLGSYEPDGCAEAAIDEERDAIRRRDLFRDSCGCNDIDRFDPFVCFLENFTEDLPKDVVSYISPTIGGCADYEIAIDTINETLRLDPSETSESADQIRVAITSGAVDLRAAIKQRRQLSDQEFHEWVVRTQAENEPENAKEIRELLDAIGLGVIDKRDLLAGLEERAKEDEQ